MWTLLQQVNRSDSDRAIFARFAAVGFTLSIIDAGGLYALLAQGLDPFLSRFLSFTVSMATGYVLNRYFTFHHVEISRDIWHSIIRHFSVHSIGGLLNFGVYSLILVLGKRFLGPPGEFPVFLPLAGVWAGGIVALCFNFFISKKHVFDK